MKNTISYKLAVARMYMHGYETSNRVYSNMCVYHFNAKTPDEQDRLGKIVKEQADIAYKYEKKLKHVLSALARSERHMSRPQRRELNLLRDRCREPWLSEIKEKTKINTNSLILDAVIDDLILDTADDLDLSRVHLCASDDFDEEEDFYESRLDYLEDNPQDYGD